MIVHLKAYDTYLPENTRQTKKKKKPLSKIKMSILSDLWMNI